nr:MAG TPA: hypothetical protein [Caudoviricetes sp.]
MFFSILPQLFPKNIWRFQIFSVPLPTVTR